MRLLAISGPNGYSAYRECCIQGTLLCKIVYRSLIFLIVTYYFCLQVQSSKELSVFRERKRIKLKIAIRGVSDGDFSLKFYFNVRNFEINSALSCLANGRGSVALRTEFTYSLSCLPECAFAHLLEFGIELRTIVRLAVRVD